ncbi:MAG: DUF1846 domain-containing protein [Clostridiales bacterium]|nr:DUF1846 domain-containing protein [Clostridiales bacterium]
MIKTGFDSAKYLEMQSKKISERIEEFGGKLYLEFGGKLFDDFHASRVLPGFAADNKIILLQNLKDKAEIIITINAIDIAKNKLRSDLGITYDDDVLRLIDIFRSKGLYVGSVVISQFSKDNQPAIAFGKKLEKLNLRVYRHYTIKGYPNDVSHIVSDDGYGKNDYVETSRQLIVVTAPGPCSGKMATCLSQLYHEHKRGIKAGYAKYETFPIWNLPLDHPVNIAYEAATADLNDVNLLDPWHFAAYNEKAVNYNRDVETFPILNLLFERIMGESPYKSPTDMGVNMVGFCISDDALCQEAARQEIIRRYFKAMVGERQYISSSLETQKIKLMMDRLGLSVNDRLVVPAALKCQKRTRTPSAAIQLNDGRIITGKTTDLMGCSSSVLLNSLKALGNIDDSVKLIAPSAIEPIQALKTQYLGSKNPRLHTDEVLIALSMSAATNQLAKYAMAQLKYLNGCEIHTTTILGSVDERVFRSLGLNVTSEPVYSTKKLYRK